MLTDYLRLNETVRRLGNRYGRSYWKLRPTLRRSLAWEENIFRIRGTQSLRIDIGESVPRIELPTGTNSPLLGLRLSARKFRTRPASVCRLDQGWLVGKFASPVTIDQRLILSSFRDEPRILGLEPHQDLEEWLTSRSVSESELAPVEHAWPMVNRLQSNYGHWLNEWCGRLELIEKYELSAGRKVNLVIPRGGPKFICESLQLLGFGPDRWIEWPEDSPPRKAHDLVFPSFRGTTVASSPAALRWLRQRALTNACQGLSVGLKRIYISRPHGGWRTVVNDDEVCAALIREGFEILQPQHLSLADQVRTFAQASIIVGLHGSGLTNILFAPKAALLELFGSYGDGTWFSMANRLGQKYEAMSCTPHGDDVVVDIDQLLRRVSAIERMAPTQPVFETP